jgi:hypothetical protein
MDNAEIKKDAYEIWSKNTPPTDKASAEHNGTVKFSYKDNQLLGLILWFAEVGCYGFVLAVQSPNGTYNYAKLRVTQLEHDDLKAIIEKEFGVKKIQGISVISVEEAAMNKASTQAPQSQSYQN